MKPMNASRRVNTSPPLQNEVASNPNTTQTAVAAVLSEQTAPTASNSEPEAASFEPAPAEPDQVLTVDARVAEPAGPEQVLDEQVNAFCNQHAAEIAAQKGKSLQAIGRHFGERE